MSLTPAEDWIHKLKFCPCHECNRVESIKQIQAEALRYVAESLRIRDNRGWPGPGKIPEQLEYEANQLHPLREGKETHDA